MGGAGGYGGYQGVIEEIESLQALGMAMASSNSQRGDRRGLNGDDGNPGNGGSGQQSGNDFDAEYKNYKLAFDWGWGCGVGAFAMKLLTCFPDITGQSQWFNWEEGRMNHAKPYGDKGRSPNQPNSHNALEPQQNKVADKGAILKQFSECTRQIIHNDYQTFQEWEEELTGHCDFHS